MFRMSMGSKSQKQNRTLFGGISRVMSPINAGPCGTPGNPPCDEEYKTGSETYKGEKDGVKGTYTKTSFQTDFEVPSKPDRIRERTPGKSGNNEPFKNPKVPGQTYKEFIDAPFGSPGKTADRYKPKAKTYGENKRSDLKFVPDSPPPPPPPPPPKKEKKLPPGFKVPGKGRKSVKIKKPDLSMGPRTKRGGGKRRGNSCGCAVNN